MLLWCFSSIILIYVLYFIDLAIVFTRKMIEKLVPNKNTCHGTSKGEADTILFRCPSIEKKANKLHYCFFFSRRNEEIIQLINQSRNR